MGFVFFEGALCLVLQELYSAISGCRLYVFEIDLQSRAGYNDASTVLENFKKGKENWCSILYPNFEI